MYPAPALTLAGLLSSAGKIAGFVCYCTCIRTYIRTGARAQVPSITFVHKALEVRAHRE